MRIVFVHGLNSNFNSVLEVLKACRDFQKKVQFSCFLGSTLLVEKICRLEEECIRDMLSYAEIH